MALTSAQQEQRNRSSDAPYRTAVRDLAARELVFAVVGPVGSGTSEIAQTLESLLPDHGYDATILKARIVLQKWATQHGHHIPSSPPLAQSESLQDAGDTLRASSEDIQNVLRYSLHMLLP